MGWLGGNMQPCGSVQQHEVASDHHPTPALHAGAGEDGGPAGVFAGNVTSANNGGFASVRCRNAEPPLDLSGG